MRCFSMYNYSKLAFFLVLEDYPHPFILLLLPPTHPSQERDQAYFGGPCERLVFISSQNLWEKSPGRFTRELGQATKSKFGTCAPSKPLRDLFGSTRRSDTTRFMTASLARALAFGFFLVWASEKKSKAVCKKTQNVWILIITLHSADDIDRWVEVRLVNTFVLKP